MCEALPTPGKRETAEERGTYLVPRWARNLPPELQEIVQNSVAYLMGEIGFSDRMLWPAEDLGLDDARAGAKRYTPDELDARNQEYPDALQHRARE